MATADSVSANINRLRSCTIEKINMSEVYCLINPKFYTCSGSCWHPPQPTISSNKTGVCAFTKTAFTASGAVGVLTYDLFHMENQECTDRIAILFSVPFNSFYDNIFGVRVIMTDCECNEALYEKMFYENDSSFIRGKAKVSPGITYNARRVKLEATMSNVGKAIIKLEIHDRLR